MASMVMVAFVQAFGPMAIAPSVPYYMAEWDRSLADVLQFVPKHTFLKFFATHELTKLQIGRNMHPRAGILQFHMGSHFNNVWKTARTVAVSHGFIVRMHLEI